MTTTPVESTDRQRAANRRTAALLFAIVAVFFVGFIASRYLADFATGMTVVGLAVLLFLVVAIGRNLRSGK
ncbi:MAG: cytochrome oxidase small assembly protein [Betaproteobacteria bacterium]